MSYQLDKKETIKLAKEIFDIKSELQNKEYELIENLVRNNMAEYFSINWRRLHKDTQENYVK